jgi:hypothetical protein
MKIIVDEYDYDRMIAYDCDGIDDKKSYDEFVEWNIKCLKESSEEDLIFFKSLYNKISNSKMSQMDLESCAVWDSYKVFFAKNTNLVIVHPR